MTRTELLRPKRGFTLVELVMVIALSGIVMVMISTVMTRPLQGFFDISRRAELTDLAAIGLSRIARDIRDAVPNSLCLGDTCGEGAGVSLRLMSISTAGRYQANTLDAGAERFDPPRCPATGSCMIPVLGGTAKVPTGAHWLIIYNTGGDMPGSSVWNSQSVSPAVMSDRVFELSGTSLIGTAPGFHFKYASPQHRFYLAREVVRYRCEGSRLLRESASDLAFSSSLSSQVVLGSLRECRFVYEPGDNSRLGLATLQVTLEQKGERVTLVRQVQVSNAP
ncbi:MAG TPA: type II secretion system protein [Pseudomonas sp.]